MLVVRIPDWSRTIVATGRYPVELKTPHNAAGGDRNQSPPLAGGWMTGVNYPVSTRSTFALHRSLAEIRTLLV